VDAVRRLEQRGGGVRSVRRERQEAGEEGGQEGDGEQAGEEGGEEGDEGGEVRVFEKGLVGRWK